MVSWQLCFTIGATARGMLRPLLILPPVVAEVNLRLIHLSISAFGSTGPLSELPGTDPVVQAMSGIMSVTGDLGGAPVLVGVPIADFTAGMVGAQAVMLALLARHKTGQGQKVELSMLSALISSWTTRLAAYWAEGKDPVANGNAHSAVTPYQAYRTKSGYAVAGVWGAGDGWPKFCAAVGRPDLVNDPRFADNLKRTSNKAELNAILEPIFVTKSTEEWAAIFAEKRALFGPVHKFSEALNHPQVLQSGLVTSVRHPTLGEVKTLAPVIQLSDTPGHVSRHPPLLGEHTEEVLQEAGLSSSAIKHLFEIGAAKGPVR
jgi:crotonobetainyl-CoA:carnitine CoA-transferase CaiB-like acyl-CoA transferase